jgi:phenylacetate-coenzyme A ligase PaaK-like adenylate-forming protein
MTEFAILDTPTRADPDPDEFIQAAMQWHFGEDTGSPYWLRRARTLEFDPRGDVKTVEDLALFPNTVNELRDVPVEDLIPRGYRGRAEIAGIFESGGTTGAPKRVVGFTDWLDHTLTWMNTRLDACEFPRDTDCLSIVPSGPHMIGAMCAWLAASRGGINFTVDMDPRWVKKLIAASKVEEADAYAEHLVDQAEFVLRTQHVGVLWTTPPMLERLSRRDDLVELINEKVRGILWGGAHLDPDTRDLLRTDVFPRTRLCGTYGSTMVLGGAVERAGLTDDEPCIFDTHSPYITFSVVDPETLRPVSYGERGQVVMNHLSKGMLLPNNLERDNATRLQPPPGAVGDSVADVSPVETFDNEAVIEGVY